MKQRAFFPRIPRPVRAMINLVLAIALGVLFYISINCPTLSFVQEFRRAEKAHLIGKSKIVDTITDYREYDKMLVGETEYGVCFFGRHELIVGYHNSKNQKEHRYTLTYYEKAEDLTVAVAPNVSSILWSIAGYSLPVYVFDAYPEAVRAEIKTTVSGEGTYYVEGKTATGPFHETFTAEADRSGDGYFRFMLKSSDGKGSLALGLLSRVASGENLASNEKDTVIPFTVRLYDASGALILEKELTISANRHTY